VQIRSAAPARRRTAAKVVASPGVVGATVAIAGMGTFGSFTDTTSPVETNVWTGPSPDPGTKA
jgi:hypothetical protein